jgi:hypothetical protein
MAAYSAVDPLTRAIGSVEDAFVPARAAATPGTDDEQNARASPLLLDRKRRRPEAPDSMRPWSRVRRHRAGRKQPDQGSPALPPEGKSRRTAGALQALPRTTSRSAGRDSFLPAKAALRVRTVGASLTTRIRPPTKTDSRQVVRRVEPRAVLPRGPDPGSRDACRFAGISSQTTGYDRPARCPSAL